MVPANAVDAPSPGDLSLLPPPSFVGRRNLPPASGRTAARYARWASGGTAVGRRNLPPASGRKGQLYRGLDWAVRSSFEDRADSAQTGTD